MKEYNNKRIESAYGILLILRRACLLMAALFSALLLFQLYMEGHFRIYDHTLRFHVRAASDRKDDQELKLMVRDQQLELIHAKVLEDKNREMVGSAGGMEALLAGSLDGLSRQADQYMKKLGYDIGVNVYLTRERFPVRRYGSVIFPAGTYHALRIDLGQAKGHNWWCALYPELCYNNEEYILTKEGEEQMRQSMSDFERKILSGSFFRWITGRRLSESSGS
ncbi:MAG: stage II sporulation protein R [Eubacterium sp.]|nr:stage II sporulation protein R [Eubacterium sp.]